MGEMSYDHDTRADAGPDRRSRQVEQEQQSLRETALHLRDSIAMLHERLGPALRVHEPMGPSAEMAMVEEALVPVADEMRGTRRILQDAHGTVTSILDRLEL